MSAPVRRGESRWSSAAVVSLGADPDGSGAQAVTVRDNMGKATTITAADLSTLDSLNLVTQGGSAFDPHSVVQLQAWPSISPNATAAYQLAVPLAALDRSILPETVWDATPRAPEQPRPEDCRASSKARRPVRSLRQADPSPAQQGPGFRSACPGLPLSPSSQAGRQRSWRLLPCCSRPGCVPCVC
jgi:hypothetical protein